MTDFEAAQQELLERFKKQMRVVADKVLDELYVDVSPHAETDAHINFTNVLRDELSRTLCDEIATQNGHYSWASSMRMKLLSTYKEQLHDKIVQDLQDKIESLEETIKQMRKWR